VAFVLSAGTVRGLSRPSYSTPQRIQLSPEYYADYLEIWRRQDSVRTVVTFLARNIAQLGLHTFERKGDTDRERLQEHPLALLMRRPNPWTTRYRMINALVHDFAIYDNAYWLKSKLDDGSTVGLVRLPPLMVSPGGDNNWTTPEYFEVQGQKGKREIPADQIVYFRGYSGLEDEGISPLEALRQSLKETWAGSEMREQAMRNGARTSGYLERPAGTPWSSEAKTGFKKDWQSQYAGNGPQAGGTPILEDGMKFVEASQTAKDLQYIEGRKLTREEVAAAYFIPPPMVGILDKASFSNITEQHKMLYQDTLGPWLTMIQEEIALQLIPDFEAVKPDDFYVEFNLREKLTGSFVERQDAITKAVGGPTMTINEARALDNRPPIDGGDELIRPLNVTQNGDQDPTEAEPEPDPTDDEDLADEDEDEQED